MKQPSYYRARIALIDRLIAMIPADRGERNSVRSLLKMGYISPDLLAEGNPYGIDPGDEDGLIRAELFINVYGDEPLTFRELCSYSTWYVMHPEKQAGEEVVTTSIHFPITIKGGKDDIVATLNQAIAQAGEKPTRAAVMPDRDRPEAPNQRKRLAIAKAKALKLKLQLMSTSALSGIPQRGRAIERTLGALPADTLLRLDQATLGRILQRQEQKKTQGDTLTFDEVMATYNKGISLAEIQAWVWYKRSLGIPMTAWKRYFLTSDKGPGDRLVYAQTTTELLDNNWAATGQVPAGTLIGKPSKKTHEYNGETYQFVTATDGSVMIVRQSTIEIKHSGQTVDEKELHKLVNEGVLFYHEGEYLPYPIYAYGNMYDRDLSLRQDRDHILTTFGKEVYERHEEVVATRKPKVISVQNPDANERPKITPFSSFAKRFTITAFAEDSGIDREFGTDNDGNPEELTLRNAFRYWLTSRSKNELGVLTATQIWNYMVEGKGMRGMSDDEKNTILLYGNQEMEQQFSEFMYRGLTFDDKQRLDFAWNRLYNGFSDVPYSRIPVGFTCSSRFMLSDHLEFTAAQREGIAFMQAAGSGIVAYDVGVGKTLTAIITIANAFDEGKMKRAYIVVPNPTYAKWKREIVGYEHPETKKFYPGVLSNTDITLNDWYNLGKGYKEGIDFKKAVPEKSITLLTYEGFAKIGFSKKVMDELFRELSDILSQRGDEDKSQRDFEKKQERHRELIGVGNKDTLADIDTLGFDFMVIDEAHNFKNVFATSPTDDEGVKRFNMEGSESARAIKAFFLANFIQRRFGRNVMLLTATPFTNSPLEIYSMLSLVAYDKLRAMGINNLQAFMETFIVQDLEYTNNYDGDIVIKAVVKRFNNRLVLQKLIHNHITYKTGEDAGIKRPCKINLPRLYAKQNGSTVKLDKEKQIVTYLEQTNLQKAAQAQINALAMDKSKLSNVFRAMALSLDNALSPFMFPKYQAEDFKEFVEGSPKIAYVMQCIASVKKHHEDQQEPVSGQVIYMNRGKDFFPYIKQYLLEVVGYATGVKHDGSTFDEVELITGSVSGSRKEKIKDAFLAGKVKVIIGTSTISEGIDLQKRGTTLYILQPDWNPTSIRQVEGRIHRQGNLFGYVRVVMPLVQDSMDVFVFQKLEEKSSRINDIWYRSDRGNVLDQESLDPEEVKFALYTNVDKLTKIEIDKERKDIDRRLNVATEAHDLLVRLEVKIKQFYELQHQLRTFLTVNALKLMDDYYFTQGNAQDNVRRQVTGWTSYRSDQEPPESKKKWAAFLESAEQLRNDTQTFNESSQPDDKDMLKLCRRYITLYEKAKQYSMQTQLREKVSDFKASLAEIRKAERTTLAQRGYSLQDNFQPAIDEVKRDMDRIAEELERTRSPEFYEERLAEVIEKKKRLTIQGLSIGDLVRQFSGLNYLLDYRAQDINSNACDLPDAAPDRRTGALKAKLSEGSKTADREAVARDKKLRLAKAKAKALKIKLQLMAAQ